jgi:hypothetical protein
MSEFPTPQFEPVVVADKLKDGYWVQAADITGNGKPDLVCSGLAEGEVVWYENPGWTAHHIAKFPLTVSLDIADIDGDGRLDIVACHDYGTCMYHCKPEDGKISWLQNPGQYGPGETWNIHHIDNLMASHRLRFGHFTQDRLELLVAPVVGPEGVHGPVPVMLYTVPSDPAQADKWEGQLVDGASFRVVHDVVPGKYGAASDRDSVMLASEEGIIWFRPGSNGAWQKSILGTGELTEVGTTGFKGSGNVAVGKVGNDPHAYIATVEPFHGNTVAVYTKTGKGDLADPVWTRTILDVFGDPNNVGEGAGHHVITADFDGDGDDEFLVALRGPMPWQGVFYYKAVDASKGQFLRWRVSSSSAARIAVADFDGDGRLDFATTGYYTPGYFLCDNPQVLVFKNRFGGAPHA